MLLVFGAWCNIAGSENTDTNGRAYLHALANYLHMQIPSPNKTNDIEWACIDTWYGELTPVVNWKECQLEATEHHYKSH